MSETIYKLGMPTYSELHSELTTLREVAKAARGVIVDVRQRYNIESNDGFTCPYMKTLDAALAALDRVRNE
jgi:hypothetical protein